LDFYSASSLKQQSICHAVVDMSLHLDALFQIPRQPVFALTPYCYVLSREATIPIL
jgi:hypothetical protein